MFVLRNKSALSALAASVAVFSGAAFVPVHAATDSNPNQQQFCTSMPCQLCHIDMVHSVIPAEWKIVLDRHPLVPKGSLYIFTASVQDPSGKGVENARVFLRILSHGAHLVQMKAAGKGNYWVSTTDLASAYSNEQVVVEPAASQ